MRKFFSQKVEQTNMMWMVSKIGGFPPKSSISIRDFHYFHHPFWGFSPYFWFNTHVTGPETNMTSDLKMDVRREMMR